MSERLIRQYYSYFNRRRVGDAASLFADDATFDHPPFAKTTHGASGYMHFAETWLRAFPDAQLRIDHVTQQSATVAEIDLTATGTHSGILDLGPYGRLKPSGREKSTRDLLICKKLLTDCAGGYRVARHDGEGGNVSPPVYPRQKHDLLRNKNTASTR